MNQSASGLDMSLAENSELKAENILSPVKKQRMSDENEEKVSEKISLLEREKKIFGFILPPKIERELPLMTKGVSGTYCHDIIDDIYAFYKEDRVSSIYTAIFSLLFAHFLSFFLAKIYSKELFFNFSVH